MNTAFPGTGLSKAVLARTGLLRGVITDIAYTSITVDIAKMYYHCQLLLSLQMCFPMFVAYAFNFNHIYTYRTKPQQVSNDA